MSRSVEVLAHVFVYTYNVVYLNTYITTHTQMVFCVYWVYICIQVLVCAYSHSYLGCLFVYTY